MRATHLSPDPADGNGPAINETESRRTGVAPVSDQNPDRRDACPTVPAPSVTPPAPAEPPAARVVIDGAKTEADLTIAKLQQEKLELTQAVKDRESEVAKWQDEHHRLREHMDVPDRVARPVKRKPFRLGKFV